MSIFERGLCIYLQFLYFTLHHGICTCPPLSKVETHCNSQSHSLAMKAPSVILRMGDLR